MIARATLAVLLLAAAAPATAQPAPARTEAPDAEIWLWQQTVASGTAASYAEYLRFYPDGRFVPLAKLRLQALGGAPVSAPQTPSRPAASATSLPAEFSLYHIDVTPAVAASGQLITIRSRGFLPPALYDQIVVVPAGTPDVTPAGTLDESKVRVKSLVTLFDLTAGAQIPAQPAGAYEVRYMSRAYNPEGRLEVMARAPITWR